MTKEKFIRSLAEEQYAGELKTLIKEDPEVKPENWKMSPSMVSLYILGGKTASGNTIEPKYFGERRLVELAIATLLTDRALLLIGVPGTAKTWLSEHLTAAISGDSSRMGSSRKSRVPAGNRWQNEAVSAIDSR